MCSTKVENRCASGFRNIMRRRCFFGPYERNGKTFSFDPKSEPWKNHVPSILMGAMGKPCSFDPNGSHEKIMFL
jgi:hypothetical protein